MENQEEVHEILTAFEKKPSKDIPPLLEDYLRSVAKTGKIVFPWSRVKPLFVSKLEQVMEHFNKDVPYDHLAPYPNVEQVKYEEMRSRILEAVHRFTGAPFTIQRICELVTQSKAHYTRCDKFLRGIEKNVMVVSTVDPCGRWVSSGAMTPKVDPQRVMMNGLDVNGVCQQQRADPNDINEGQPFGGLPHPDWSNNNSAAVSVWPTQGVVDEVAATGPGSLYLGPPVTQSGTGTEQPDPVVGKTLDTAAQDSVQVSSAGDSITATSQIESFPSSDHVVSDSCAPSSSSSSSSSESSSSSPPSDSTAPFSFVTKSSTEQDNALTDSKVQEADNEPEPSQSADSVEASESQEIEVPAEKPESETEAESKPSEELEPGEVVNKVEVTPEPMKESQEVEGSLKHSADDSEDAPPEKRLKAETEEPAEEDHKDETVDTTCISQSSEAQVTDSTTDSESAETEILPSSEEAGEKQIEGDQSDKISQSENVTSESEAVDTNQSDITSTDDAQQQEVTQENIDQSESGSVSVDQSEEACVSQSDTVEEKQSVSVAVPETSEVTPANEQEGSDSVMEGGDKPSDSAESSECNSTTEMMETDSGSEETKPEGPDGSSVPDESEPMDQE